RDDPKRIILSRRYIIHENLVKIMPELVISDGIAEKRTHQEIEFMINYQGLELLFPEKDIKVVIRQNDSWVNIISGLKPTMIQDRQKVLEYHHFNLENNFPGG